MSMNIRPEAQELLERVSNFLESEVAPNEAKFHEQIKLISFHQDQVIKIPNFVEHLAENDFCKYYALSVDDYIFTIQGHPEFSNTYALDLLEIKRESIGEKQYFESKYEKVNKHRKKKGDWKRMIADVQKRFPFFTIGRFTMMKKP